MRTGFAFAMLLALCLGACATAQVVYVDCDAPGPEHDGASWDTACLTIQEGVDAATPGGEVWVADGTYVENVIMGEGVAIYGGFLGAEPGGYEDSLDQRDWVNHVATIDGNQSGSCVVMAVDGTVDGFAATNGSGTLTEAYLWCGGAFYCEELGQASRIANNTISRNSVEDRGAGLYCSRSSLTVAGNTFVGNSAGFGGGAVWCGDYSWPAVTHNAMVGNAAVDSGGGIYCWYSSPFVAGNLIVGNTASTGGGIYNGSGGPTLTLNRIEQNSAEYGGAIYSYGGAGPDITMNVILGNEATALGGGIYCHRGVSTRVTGNLIARNGAEDGGGIYLSDSSPPVTNNTIVANTANRYGYGEGGGIYCYGGMGGAADPVISNNIVSGNEAAEMGGGIHSYYNAQPALVHNDFWANVPDDYGGYHGPGMGDISADPVFAAPGRGDWHLRPGSPCIDAGDDWAPYIPETDWDGEDRLLNGMVDIGADEFCTWTATAPDPQPECDGPLFGEPQAGFPGWVWFSIPMTPAYSGAPNDVLGFQCNGRMFRYDKYVKAPIVYQPPFSEWDLAVGDSYILWLDSEVTNPSYEGLSPFTPWEFEFKLGRQGWTWVGMPGMTELGAEDFMASVKVRYPSDETGVDRTAQDDYDAIPDNWITWGWPYWNTWLQAPETFTPYAPFGHTTCYPWVGYRVWVKVGTAMDEDDTDQVTLIWP